MSKNSASKKKEESRTSDGLVLKMKGKLEEADRTTGLGQGSTNKSKYKKLKTSVFVGENPVSWVYRAEHFVEINDLTEAENVKVVVVSFAQNEINRFQWSNNRKKVTSWYDLKNRIFDHFQPTREGSLGVQLIQIKQEGSYADYLKKFLKYSAPLPEMAECVDG